LFDTYDELENLLKTNTSTNGVYFIPAFGFLEVNDGEKTSVGTGFIGLRPSTTKAEMVRAIFDSIAYSIKMRMDLILKDLKHHNIPLNSVR
jgi:glycerol kinase